MELAQRMNRAWLASAGLVVLLACSSAPPRAKAQARAEAKDTSGPVPVNEAKVDSIPASPFLPSPVSIAPAPASEVQALLHRFPPLAGYRNGDEVDSTAASRFRINRVSVAELKQAFPGVRFYLDLSGTVAGHDLMAITRDSFYDMPFEFNLLLFATRRRLNDSNVVAMAKAFVLLSAVSDAAHDTASSSGMPPITILDARRTHAPDVMNPNSSGVCVKFKVGGEVRELCAGDWRGQFRSVVERNLHLEEDRKRPSGLDGTIEVLSYILDPPIEASEESVH
jgi:hypothetical protein